MAVQHLRGRTSALSSPVTLSLCDMVGSCSAMFLVFLRVTVGERDLDIVPFIVCCRPGGAVGRAYIPVFVYIGVSLLTTLSISYMIRSALPILKTEPPVTNGLVGQVFIYGQVNRSAFINVPWEVIT